MIVFPNCKINLGLNIIRRREDDFHDLETVFYPLPFTDVLEIIESGGNDDINFTTSGIEIAGDSGHNLCVKAFRLIKEDHPQLPPVLIHLHKAVPPGAGLGGGSSDGAFTLKLLNEKFQLNLSAGQLISYALMLGSDCPFFIINQPCFATGRGELLTPIGIDLSNYKIILVNPGVHINTGHAFSQITPALPGKSIAQIIQQPVSTWKGELQNDFEKIIFNTHPGIGKIKEEMYNNGAVYASMSGSGSTVYGIFTKETATNFSFPAGYFIRELSG